MFSLWNPFLIPNDIFWQIVLDRHPFLLSLDDVLQEKRVFLCYYDLFFLKKVKKKEKRKSECYDCQQEG